MSIWTVIITITGMPACNKWEITGSGITSYGRTAEIITAVILKYYKAFIIRRTRSFISMSKPAIAFDISLSSASDWLLYWSSKRESMLVLSELAIASKVLRLAFV